MKYITIIICTTISVLIHLMMIESKQTVNIYSDILVSLMFSMLVFVIGLSAYGLYKNHK